MTKRILGGLLALSCPAASAFTITLDSADFGVTPTFNPAPGATFNTAADFSLITNFIFEIEIDEPLRTGVFNNPPTLSRVNYSIGGNLGLTPSGFPGFALARDMDGAEFYAQGSSLSFAVAASADLSDGLQASELTGSPFLLNAREENTGRYHPTFFQINLDGTGLVQNSDNSGPTAINPASLELVDVDFAEEYISTISFDPATTTIAVPEPGASVFLLAGTFLLRRRRS